MKYEVLRQCIIKAIYDGLNDMENGVEVGSTTNNTTDCDEYLDDLSKIEDNDLRAIWDYAEETFFYYQHKEEPWKEMAVTLRELVVKLEKNQPIKDSKILKDAYQMLQNVKPQGCLLSLLKCFILHK